MRFYVRSNLGSVLCDRSGNKMQYRYEVNGELIEISKFVKTFIWFDPIRRTCEIHEQLSGLALASHPVKEKAIEIVQNIFKRTGEQNFFNKCNIAGPVHTLPEISYDEAMHRSRQHVEAERARIAAS